MAEPIKVAHHLLLCATPTKGLCSPDPVRGATSWDALKRLVRELGLDHPSRANGIVLRSKVDCLRICETGPVLLIWPEGIVYGGITADRIESILQEHIINQRPIEDWIIKRYSLAMTTPMAMAMPTPMSMSMSMPTAAPASNPGDNEQPSQLD